MSKYVNINSTDDFEKFVKNIDSSKFSTKITEELFKKNNWYFTSYDAGTGQPKLGWMPDLGIMLYDPDDADFEDPNDVLDIQECKGCIHIYFYLDHIF